LSERDEILWTSDGCGPPFYKIGRHNRWKRNGVLAWIDATQVEA
jgi:hypothetical protein